MSSYVERGQLLFEQQRYDLAESMLRKAMSETPDDAVAQSLLALSIMAQDRCDEGLAMAQQAVSLEPDLALPHFAISCAYCEKEAYGKARKAAETALRLAPQMPMYHAHLGEISLSEGKWEEAIDWADRALAFDPEDAKALNIRAVALTQTGRAEEAQAMIDHAMSRNPEDPRGHANRGWAHLHGNRHREALDCFRQSLMLDPEYDYAKQGLVTSLKARHAIYRWILAFFLWTSRLSTGMRIAVLIGIITIMRALRVANENAPQYGFVLKPLLAVGIAFIVLTWIADPLFTLLLRFNKYGRYALNRQQLLGANFLAGLLGGAAVAATAGYLFEQTALYALAICMVGMIIPVSATFEAATLLRFRIGAATSIVLALLAVLITGGAWLELQPLFVGAGAAFLLLFVGFTWAFTLTAAAHR